MFGPIEYAPATTDWFGRWRSADNVANDWGIDRESQRTHQQFTGIANITMQDQAVTESMGGITDHGFEHLAPTDQMIARTRRRLLLTARALQVKGTVPPGVDDPDLFFGARAGSFLHDPSFSLAEAYKDQLGRATRWPVARGRDLTYCNESPGQPVPSRLGSNSMTLPACRLSPARATA